MCVALHGAARQGARAARGRETGRTRGHPHASGAVALREITATPMSCPARGCETGRTRGTGPRDRAHARAPACQRGSCPTRDYATPRRCDLKPRSESRAQYSNMRGWDTCFKPSWDMCEPWNMKCGILSDCGTKKVSMVQNKPIRGVQPVAHNTNFDSFLV